MTTTPARPLVHHLLPGQAAAPEGPCDLTGMYVMHHAFRRDLRRFVAAAAATPAGERGTWRAVHDRWRRFAHELHGHHAKEDDHLWPVLLAAVDAAGDEPAHRVLVEMEAEHVLIDPLLARVEEHLTALARGLADPARAEHERAGLAAVVVEAQAVLGDHLAHEERAAIEIVQRYLDAAQWARLEEEHLAAKPSPAGLLWMLPWIADGVPREVLDSLLASGGTPLRVLLAIGSRGYERLERRAFAHVPRD